MFLRISDTAQKMKFSIKDFFAENCGFGHIYRKNP